MVVYNFKYESLLSTENYAVNSDPDFDKYCLQLFQSMKEKEFFNQTQQVTQVKFLPKNYINLLTKIKGGFTRNNRTYGKARKSV